MAELLAKVAEIADRDAAIAHTPMRLLPQAEADRRYLLMVCKALSQRLANLEAKP